MSATSPKHLQPVAYLDAPRVFDAAVQNIPGSASSPTQVVARMAKGCQAIDFYDGVGRYVGVYVGAPGSEALVGVIGGGGKGRIDVVIPRGARVSFRNEEADVINSGTIWVHFLNQPS